MLSEEPTVDPTARVDKTTLGRYTEVGANVRLQEVHLDDYSYVVDRSDVIYTDIGKFVNIASDVRINPGNHPMEWVSQHHFLYRIKQYGLGEEDNQPFFNWRRLQRVTIGHDVWIGHKAIVLPGVTVGNGAVVAAGAVASRDVKPYSVVGGVPAKPLRSRFPEPIWRCLEEIQWWNWDHETIKERLDDFYDIRRFLDLYGNT